MRSTHSAPGQRNNPYVPSDGGSSGGGSSGGGSSGFSSGFLSSTSSSTRHSSHSAARNPQINHFPSGFNPGGHDNHGISMNQDEEVPALIPFVSQRPPLAQRNREIYANAHNFHTGDPRLAYGAPDGGDFDPRDDSSIAPSSNHSGFSPVPNHVNLNWQPNHPGRKGQGGGNGGNSGGGSGGSSGHTSGFGSNTSFPTTPAVQRTMQHVSRTFVIDPYKGNINPGSPTGLKLFMGATREVPDDEKLELNQDNAKKIKDMLLFQSSKYGWGAIVEYVLTSKGDHVNIIHNNHLVTLADMKCNANTYYGNGTQESLEMMQADDLNPDLNYCDNDRFQKQVRSNIIARCIFNHFTPASIRIIMNECVNFQWITSSGEIMNDGPTIVFFILSYVNPSTKVGIGRLKLQLTTAHLGKYNNNVQTMMAAMKSIYREITENHRSTHEDYTLNLFTALLTTNNSTFRNAIEAIKDNWEMGTGEHANIKPDDLISLALKKYTNMVGDKSWDKLDPAEAKLMVLTTKYEAAVSQLHAYATTSQPGSSNKSTTKPTAFDPARAIKGDGKPKMFDGIQMHWCDKGHKSTRSPHGLYMPHKPEDHDKWEAARAEKQARFRRGGKTSTTTNTTSSTKTESSEQNKLVLSKTPADLKTALMTRYNIDSDEAADFSADFLKKE